MERRRSDMKANLMLLIGAMIVAFLLGEAIVRIFYPHFAGYNMEMWRYAAELKLPLPDDDLPFHHRPGRAGTYYGVEIRTNTLGFRDDEYPVEKPPGTTRIAVLGDSFTLGWGVPFEQTFVERLERRLNGSGNGFEVINMGTGNYNTAMELALFKRKGIPLDPDLVILVYFANDAESVARSSSAWFHTVKHSYLVALSMAHYFRVRAYVQRDLDLRNYYRNIYQEGSAGLIRNREAVRELVALCRERGIDLLIVNLPDLRLLGDYPLGYATEHIRTLAEELDVPFLDLTGVLGCHDPETLWVSKEDAHANAAAHGVIADALFNELADGRFRRIRHSLR